MILEVVVLLILYLTIASYGSRISAEICNKNILNSVVMHSVASGVLITALLMFFFKEIYDFPEPTTYLLLTVVSFGILFSINAHQRFHHKRNKFKHELTLIFEALHYLFIGVFFAEIAELSTLNTFLSAIPILLLKFVFAYEKYNHHETESKTERYLMEIMTVSGFLIAIMIGIPDILYRIALAIVTGGIFYSVISLIFAKVDVDAKMMISGAVIYGMLFLL